MENEILRRLSHPGTIKLLRIMKKERVLSFSELMFEVQLNPSTLNTILRTLVENGIIEKDDQGNIITEKGRRVTEILEKLSEEL